MNRPCTPQEIISRAHDSVTRAKSTASLQYFSDAGIGAINCLFDLGLIGTDSWRVASHLLSALADRRNAELEEQGGKA
ncbi:hypothetical protein D3C78_428460 [compost metagenome]